MAEQLEIAPDQQAAQTAVMAAEMRSGTQLSIVPASCVVVVLIFIKITFGPLVEPPWLLDLWLGGVAAVMAATAIAVAVFNRQTRTDGEVLARWQPRGVLAQRALAVCLAVSPWILLPHADPALLSLMIMLYVWWLTTSIVMSNAAMPISVLEMVMHIGSLIGFLWWYRNPDALRLSIFLVMVGITLLSLQRLVRRAVVAALEAHWQSTCDAAALSDALATVAAERDAKTRFIASASHDLQQPLQAAQLFFENAVDSQDAATRARAIAGARAAFVSTQALIGAMLDHLRLEAGAVRAHTETLALAPLIVAVAAEHQPAAHAAGMRIIAVLGGWQVAADPALLRRALGNLVTNAVRHAQGERILIGARRRGNRARLWVIDDGNGVPAGESERLFDDYAQGSGDHAQRGGFGLGLASTRRALTLMNGEAGFEPRWRGGAAFWLELPLAEAAIADRSEPLCAAA